MHARFAVWGRLLKHKLIRTVRFIPMNFAVQPASCFAAERQLALTDCLKERKRHP